MRDDPVVLDEHRGMAAQKATELRRHLAEIEADQAALRRRQEELEKFLLAAPSTTWEDVAEKARYLIGLFAATFEGQDPRRQKIIASVLDDFKRLSMEEVTSPSQRRHQGDDTRTAAPRAASEKRESAADHDSAASRKANEQSRGKRQRGGGSPEGASASNRDTAGRSADPGLGHRSRRSSHA